MCDTLYVFLISLKKMILVSFDPSSENVNYQKRYIKIDISITDLRRNS